MERTLTLNGPAQAAPALLPPSVVQRVHETLPHVPPPVIARFTEHFYAHSTVDAPSLIDEAAIEHQARRLTLAWKACEAMTATQAGIMIEAHEGFTFLAVASHDGPSIVDTLLLALSKLSIQTVSLENPVIPVRTVGKAVEVLSPRFPIFQAPEDTTFWAVQVCVIEGTLDATARHTLRETVTHTLQALFTVNHATAAIEKYSRALEKTVKITADYAPYRQDVWHATLFMRWLKQGYFTFLGARYVAAGNLEASGCLGLFQLEEYTTQKALTPRYFKRPVAEQTLYSIAKLPLRSTLYHDARIVSLEIPAFENGEVVGVHQIIGIFNASFYRVSCFEVPVLRKKVQRIFERFNLKPQWRNAKLIRDLLEVVPNDELIFVSDEELFTLCASLLYGPHKVGLLVRCDEWGLNAAVQIFMPSAWYSSSVRDDLGDFLAQHLGGQVSRINAKLTEYAFVRIIVVVSFTQAAPPFNNHEALLAHITQRCSPWVERVCAYGAPGLTPAKAHHIFPPAYQAVIEPAEGARDYAHALKARARGQTLFAVEWQADTFVIKTFNPTGPLALASLLPLLQAFGVYVTHQDSYALDLPEGEVYLYSAYCQQPGALPPTGAVIRHLEAGLRGAWQGLYEVDAFNQLIIAAGLAPEEVNVLRACGRALKHMELPFALTTLARVLTQNPAITQGLWAYFDARFNPHSAWDECAFATLKEGLSCVKQREDDVILRAFLSLIGAIVRTNYFKGGRDFISFKVESARIHHLPNPKPLYEIFVYAPYMEGCHLRAGKVARGGIRWSDRMEDFRREIWDLMCTQTMKNAIIVPTGAKGGFVCKNMPRLHAQGAPKEVIAAEVARCYQTLIRGILDLTDTIQNGQVVKPAGLRIYDEDDPYLAVAADKGTATFSDMANAIAAEYGFWLGDAFASGGSKGYDHKKMAITARGAWVSVRHHFQALGIDVDKQPITVVGVGDMSGDVFGNGMLQSHSLKLVAAFNHQHIFLDPTPTDLEASFNERLRLFNKTGSSWADYNPALISPGGGVYSRALKAIPLTPQVAACLGVDASVPELTPEALIQHILRAPVDLLWFGGIGAYVRATSENDEQAADHHNDSVRITAAALRARVIGEGANLPLTQRARIEYAQHGGRLNTDSIDNSAGVDCSDHEVNLKIVLSAMVEAGALSLPQRDALLKDVGAAIAHHVLQDNLNQNRILTLMEWEARHHGAEYQRLLQTFLAGAERAWDALPDTHTLEMRLLSGQVPLVRPELCMILSRCKNSLKKSLSGQLDITLFEEELIGYFPPRIQKQCGAFIRKHLLKNELLSTLVANRLINLLGPCFVINTLGALNQSPAAMVTGMYKELRTLGLEAMEAQLYSLVDGGDIEKAGALMRRLQHAVRSHCA